MRETKLHQDEKYDFVQNYFGIENKKNNNNLDNRKTHASYDIQSVS